jgi:hypothetical protein
MLQPDCLDLNGISAVQVPVLTKQTKLPLSLSFAVLGFELRASWWPSSQPFLL